MDVGDVVADFELPDETGTPPAAERVPGQGPGGAVLLPGRHDLWAAPGRAVTSAT